MASVKIFMVENSISRGSIYTTLETWRENVGGVEEHCTRNEDI
jgi:hypothetical protein